MDFNRGTWQDEINVRDFIMKNYTPYDGDPSFLKMCIRDRHITC